MFKLQASVIEPQYDWRMQRSHLHYVHHKESIRNYHALDKVAYRKKSECKNLLNHQNGKKESDSISDVYAQFEINKSLGLETKKDCQNDQKEEEKRKREALYYLQKLGKQRRECQLSIAQQMGSRVTHLQKYKTQENSEGIAFDLAQQEQESCSRNVPQLKHPSSITEKQYPNKQAAAQNRSKYLRRGSSFEKATSIQFNKICSKFQTVENLMQNTKNSQWAFDYKQTESNQDEQEYQRSLISYQREGLRSIAQNLNNLSQEVELKQRNEALNPQQSQQSFQSNKHTSLQLKIQPCEFQREDLFDIEETFTPEDLQRSNNNRHSKTVRKLSGDEDGGSSSGFSDVISSLTRKQTIDKSIRLDDKQIKGINRNIRKLTQDLMQSDYNQKVYLESTNRSLGKISPPNFRQSHEISEDKTVRISIQNYSTTGNSPEKIDDSHKSNDKLQSQDFDSIDVSFNEEYQKQQQIFSKNNSSQNVNFCLQDQRQNKVDKTQKHKSGRYLQLNDLPVQFTKEHDSNQYQSTGMTHTGTDEPFNFEPKDFFTNEDSYGIENQENISQHSYFRKLTQDDAIKQPILVPTRNLKTKQSIYKSISILSPKQNE